ncbi:MAG: hypothetical protein GY762_08440 [Proteobacteria bacterium]|nr:hypothetical protein [Pseudomonadota bacterium]
MEHPLPVDQLPAPVQKVCGPDAPPPLKAMAASGLAPMGPTDLLTVLYYFAYDEQQDLTDKATASLKKLPDKVLLGALEQLSVEQVLDGLTRLLVKRSAAIERILLNQATASLTVTWIASHINDERNLEIVASNEARLLEHPEIIAAFYNNKAARMSTADRMIELAIRNGIELTGIACFAEVKAAIQGELIAEPSDEPTPDDTLFKQTLEREEWNELDEKAIDEAIDAREEGVEGKEETIEKVEKLELSLAQMPISSKIRLATLGSSNQRAVLIRDSNKLVTMSVIKSPGIRESEVMQYSKYRSLPEEALRYMATKRDWIKHYPVKLNLVQNPKCPIEYALRFLTHLRPPDLRAIERDRNVPNAITRAAKQLREKRTR